MIATPAAGRPATFSSPTHVIATAILTAGLAAWSPGEPARAADANGNFAVYGLGNASCHRYGRDRREDASNRAYHYYTSAYLTLYNETTDKTFSVAGNLSLDDVLAELDALCSENPLMGFHDALGALTEIFHPRRLQRAGDRHRQPAAQEP